jgi:hypothetical protein
MRISISRTLAATLIATAAGLAVWLFGFAERIWPTHPQICAILITIAVSIVVMRFWPTRQPRT